jgi:glycosyltransferase involved in cell wall biosynthesis
MKLARMRILFVSRAYPPVTGGIENQNAGLASALAGAARLTLVANKRGKRFLPLFLPWAFLRMLLACRRNDLVLLGDGVLAPLGALLKRLAPRARVVCVIHGLDISFATRPGLLAALYARINLPALRRLDLLVAVGRATIDVAVAHGVARERLRFIPNGIFPDEFAARPPRASLETLIGESLAGRQVIVRVGRYVTHKGVAWFIREVMPRLPADVFFIAAGPVVAANATGDAGCYEDCVRAVKARGLEDRVRLLTTLRWEDVRLLYATADVVVSPNVRVPGSMEGFGINVIEAAASGAPVVAARIDGLQDAVEEGRNGFLVDPADGAAFAARITALLGDESARRAFGQRACADVRVRFAWPAIAARYMEEFRAL